jgi:hypothetical protein
MGKLLTQMLVNNTGAAKVLLRNHLEQFVKENLVGKEKNALLQWIPTVFEIKTVQLTLPIGLAAQTSVTALLGHAGVTISETATPLVALVGGNYKFNAFKSVLVRIAIAEDTDVSIILAQPERTPALHENKNMSVDFMLKHAQPDLTKARAVARQRFTQAGPFVGQPAPPVSQNIEKKAFEDFRIVIDDCTTCNLFETAQTYVEAQTETLLKAFSAVQSVQYITQATYGVRSFNWNPAAAGGATFVNETPPVVAQNIQFAMTRSANEKLIVNHFTSPITATQPRPLAGDWREVAYEQLEELSRTVQRLEQTERPRVFYLVQELANRQDY